VDQRKHTLNGRESAQLGMDVALFVSSKAQIASGAFVECGGFHKGLATPLNAGVLRT
jgi:hypothetical protein